jgi:hypothetical protein
VTKVPLLKVSQILLIFIPATGEWNDKDIYQRKPTNKQSKYINRNKMKASKKSTEIKWRYYENRKSVRKITIRMGRKAIAIAKLQCNDRNHISGLNHGWDTSATTIFRIRDTISNQRQ